MSFAYRTLRTNAKRRPIPWFGRCRASLRPGRTQCRLPPAAAVKDVRHFGTRPKGLSEPAPAKAGGCGHGDTLARNGPEHAAPFRPRPPARSIKAAAPPANVTCPLVPVSALHAYAAMHLTFGKT